MKAIIVDYRALFLRYLADISAKYPIGYLIYIIDISSSVGLEISPANAILLRSVCVPLISYA